MADNGGTTCACAKDPNGRCASCFAKINTAAGFMVEAQVVQMKAIPHLKDVCRACFVGQYDYVVSRIVADALGPLVARREAPPEVAKAAVASLVQMGIADGISAWPLTSDAAKKAGLL